MPTLKMDGLNFCVLLLGLRNDFCLHQNLLIAKDLTVKSLAIFFLYPLQLQALTAFLRRARDCYWQRRTIPVMAFCTTFTAKVFETRWMQVLGTLLFIINDLQKTATQGLDEKNRRCKSWFYATPVTSFILPKRSPYLGISIKKPFCICKSPINMIYYNRVYKLVYISNRQ